MRSKGGTANGVSHSWKNGLSESFELARGNRIAAAPEKEHVLHRVVSRVLPGSGWIEMVVPPSLTVFRPPPQPGAVCRPGERVAPPPAPTPKFFAVSVDGVEEQESRRTWGRGYCRDATAGARLLAPKAKKMTCVEQRAGRPGPPILQRRRSGWGLRMAMCSSVKPRLPVGRTRAAEPSAAARFPLLR